MFLLLANDGNRVAVRGHIIVRRGPCPALIRSHTTTRLPPSVGGGESPEREPTVARKASLLRSDRDQVLHDSPPYALLWSRGEAS